MNWDEQETTPEEWERLTFPEEPKPWEEDDELYG